MSQKFKHLKLFSLLGVSLLTAIGVISGVSLSNKSADRVDADDIWGISYAKVSGSFNGWSSVELSKISSNEFKKSFLIDKGDYEFGCPVGNVGWESWGKAYSDFTFSSSNSGSFYGFSTNVNFKLKVDSTKAKVTFDVFNSYYQDGQNKTGVKVDVENASRTITLEKNGGTGGSGNITNKYWSQTISNSDITAPTKTGYTFDGWYTTSSLKTPVSFPYTIDENATFYAKWTAKTTIVTLDSQGGTSGTSSVTATYGLAMPTATMPTKQGNTFNGYFDASSGGTQYYTSTGESARNWDKESDNVTLYAQWTEITKPTYTLNYNNNGGSGSMSSTLPVVDENYQIPTNEFSRTGYKFDGWILDSSTGDVDYDDGDIILANTFEKDSIHTLYAHWTVKTTIVTLDSQGGTGGTSSVTATYGLAMPTATMPTKQGHTFNGYFDASSGGTQYYTSTGESATNWDKESNSVTLYAQWTFKRGVYLTGSFNNWLRDGSFMMTRNGDESSFEYYYFGLQVTENTDIRVYYDQDDTTGWALRGSISYSHPLAKIENSEEHNVRILKPGTYNIYYDTQSGKYHVDRTDYGTLPGWGYGIAVNPSNPTLASEVKGLTPESTGATQYEFKNIQLNKDDVVYAYYQGGEAYSPYKMWVEEHSPEQWSHADDDKGLVVPSTGTYSFYLLRGTQGFDVVSIVNESGKTDATQFAVSFTTSIGGECKADGSTDTGELKIKWEVKATEFSELNLTAQGIIKDSFKNPSEIGEIITFVSLYNYVFGKYGNKLSLTNFAESSVTPNNAINTPLSIISNGSGMIIIIASVSIISISVIGVYFYLRKRKEY